MLNKMYLYRSEVKQHILKYDGENRNELHVNHDLESDMINNLTISELIGNLLEESGDEMEHWFVFQKIVDNIFYNET